MALARWYNSKPAVRRLWGIKDAQRLRVIVAVEPTLDDDDIYPAWLAHAEEWASELHSHMGSDVQLELIHVPAFDGIEIGAESVIIVDLLWRDATLIEPHTVL